MAGESQHARLGRRLEYRFPDFLFVGVQKAGTTWLDKNIRRHPGLWLPALKELHYFNEVHIPRHIEWTVRHRRNHGSKLLRRYLDGTENEKFNYRYIAQLADIVDGYVSDDWYGRIFSLAGLDQICGEVSPDYFLLPEVGIEHILRLSPTVKIIVSLRDPIERTWSHIRMTAQKKGTSELADVEKIAHAADFVHRADYPAMISRWRSFVPESRFKVIFMDDIVERPLWVLESICQFLGVKFSDAKFPKAETPIHVGQALEMPAAVHGLLKDRLKPVYAGMRDMFPKIGAAWSARHY